MKIWSDQRIDYSYLQPTPANPNTIWHCNKGEIKISGNDRELENLIEKEVKMILIIARYLLLGREI